MSRPRWLRALRILAFLVVLAVLVPFVVYSVPQVVGADHSFVVLSGSMEPTMSPGDAVVVTEVDPERLESGDVITFGQNGTPTTHRIVEVQPREDGLQFLTKGDANEDPDRAPVQAEQIVGEVEYVLPYVGHVVGFANTTTGFGLLVAGPLALLVVTELWTAAAAIRDGPDDEGGTEEPDAVASDAESVGQENEPGAMGGPREEPDDDADDGPATITLSQRDFRLSLLLFALYAPYSGWMAYQRLDPVSVALAVASAAGLLFAGFVVVTGGSDDDGTATAGDGDDEDPTLPPARVDLGERATEFEFDTGLEPVAWEPGQAPDIDWPEPQWSSPNGNGPTDDPGDLWEPRGSDGSPDPSEVDGR
ncbi:signal peptidase I [Haloarchaeobius amylolyticus]|uniref:signal peptidase I n=1 Tax=Haloarchaeobius amylolyticus TaxID=1198296 RepID=UPI00226F034C|nr:signal peptidase I [Haloarchaeobius amylolyticus]